MPGEPRKVRRFVYHSGLQPSGPGAVCLWAFGFAAIADALGNTVAGVVEAVLAGALDPVELVELVEAREHGLELGGRQDRPRPDRVEDLRLVELCGPASPYGLTTLWGFGDRDVARAAGLSPGRVKGTRLGGAWDPTSLPSILAYVAEARAKRGRAGAPAGRVGVEARG